MRPARIFQVSGSDEPKRLSLGAVLKVPLPGHEHVVKAGETLRDIAAQEKVDLGSLIDFNELDDPELIRVGQVVLVPAPPATLQAAAAPAPAPTAVSTPAPTQAAAPTGPTPKAAVAAAPI